MMDLIYAPDTEDKQKSETSVIKSMTAEDYEATAEYYETYKAKHSSIDAYEDRLIFAWRCRMIANCMKELKRRKR